MTPLVLTAEQDGQPFYTIACSTIPEFESESGEIISACTGLIAYSDSLEHGVLQLDD